jgi:hypothetical protein
VFAAYHSVHEVSTVFNRYVMSKKPGRRPRQAPPWLHFDSTK